LITLDEALTSVNHYACPLEGARAKSEYGIDSAVNPILIINRAIAPGRISVVLVDEVLGFQRG